MNDIIKKYIKLNPFSQNAILGCDIKVEEQDFKEFDEDVMQELTKLCKLTWKEAQKELLKEITNMYYSNIENDFNKFLKWKEGSLR